MNNEAQTQVALTQDQPVVETPVEAPLVIEAIVEPAHPSEALAPAPHIVVPGLDVEPAALLQAAAALAKAVDDGCDVRTRALLASARGADTVNRARAG